MFMEHGEREQRAKRGADLTETKFPNEPIDIDSKS